MSNTSTYFSLQHMLYGDLNKEAIFNALLKHYDERVGNNSACHVYHNGAQSIPHGTDTVLVYNSELVDTDGMHDTVTNNSRITIVNAGRYVGAFIVPYQQSVSGAVRRCRVAKNGNSSFEYGISQSAPFSASYYSTVVGVILPVMLAVGDYMQIFTYQDSGGALNVVADAVSLIYPKFALWRI